MACTQVGSLGVVCGTVVVTCFYASIVTLAKQFLDPFNNEAEQRGGDPGIGGIEVCMCMCIPFPPSLAYHTLLIIPWYGRRPGHRRH